MLSDRSKLHTHIQRQVSLSDALLNCEVTDLVHQGSDELLGTETEGVNGGPTVQDYSNRRVSRTQEQGVGLESSVNRLR